MVLDADALNVLAKEPRKNEQWLLTPHVGEAARLLNCSTSEIQQDRAAAITQLQQQYGGVIVLKGAGSLVFDGGDNIFICDAGNPGMASGGMGDVLTGVIAGLIAQGLTLIDAAKLGVMIHAMAGDCAAKKGEKRPDSQRFNAADSRVNE
jgi:Predicted sugar kinase